MTPPSRTPPTPELLAVARRVVWFKPPEQTLREKVLFLNHLMTYGTIEDLSIARQVYDDDDLRHALEHAIPGVFDPRSWAYWHVMLGLGEAPPLPVRQLPRVEGSGWRPPD